MGRGSAQSYCVLVSGTKNGETKKRLQALCETTDGFKIAEQDLALRGPGDFFGSRQHGLPLLKVASLQMDLETLRDAQQAAAAVIQTADSLNAPALAPLKARVEALFTRQEVSPANPGARQSLYVPLIVSRPSGRETFSCAFEGAVVY